MPGTMDYREVRAQRRRQTATLRKRRLGEPDDDDAVTGAEAISLVYGLTRAAGAGSGAAESARPRADLPCVFLRGLRT